jgi:hypothetical protein
VLEAQARGVPGALLQQQLEAGEIKGPALLTALGLSLWTQEACSGISNLLGLYCWLVKHQQEDIVSP